MQKRRSPSTHCFQASFFHFRGPDNARIEGYGDSENVRLRDSEGEVWQGTAELDEGIIRLRFRNSHGRTMSGVSDGVAITLRDDKGVTWRGYAG
ncbi:MAG: hypothetical protein FJW39_24520 [Acidobacteria bacterium]|nr:hypothetical protein [Acidobacteriota bacterium]